MYPSAFPDQSPQKLSPGSGQTIKFSQTPDQDTTRRKLKAYMINGRLTPLEPCWLLFLMGAGLFLLKKLMVKGPALSSKYFKEHIDSERS